MKSSVPGTYPCGACAAVFPSAYGRHTHELFGHYPAGWRPSPELAAKRTRERKRRADLRGLVASKRNSNRRAAQRGLAAIPLAAAWPYGPCAYCGGGQTGWDHVIPLSKGGAHSLANLVPCCRTCNTRKHTQGPERAAASLVETLTCDSCGISFERPTHFGRINAARGSTRVACSLACRNRLHSLHMRARAAA